jgi:hypothetical protein
VVEDAFRLVRVKLAVADVYHTYSMQTPLRTHTSRQQECAPDSPVLASAYDPLCTMLLTVVIQELDEEKAREQAKQARPE